MLGPGVQGLGSAGGWGESRPPGDRPCGPRAVCNQTLCEGLAPTCSPGHRLLTHFQEDSCCPSYSCGERPITQGWGAWLALGMTGFCLEMKAGLGWGPRHGHAGSAANPEILFPPECDPDLCEAVQVPSCRQDQILITGRLGDSCCISYLCGGWTCPPMAAGLPGSPPPPLSPLLPWVAGRQGWGSSGGRGTGRRVRPLSRKKCRRKPPLLQAVHY